MYILLIWNASNADGMIANEAMLILLADNANNAAMYADAISAVAFHADANAFSAYTIYANAFSADTT